MTNEEKAIIIAKKNHKIYDDYYDSMQECIESAIQMAEWKEQQMIEKAFDWLNEHANEYFPSSYGLQANTAGLLVYYFKKAMEE